MQPQKQTNIPVLALSPLVQGKVFGIPEEDVQKRGPQWSPCQRPGSSWVMRNVKLMLRKALLFLLSSFMVTVAHMPTSLVLLWRWGHRQAVHRRTRGWFLPTIWGPSHRGGVLGEILNFPSSFCLDSVSFSLVCPRRQWQAPALSQEGWRHTSVFRMKPSLLLHHEGEWHIQGHLLQGIHKTVDGRVFLFLKEIFLLQFLSCPHQNSNDEHIGVNCHHISMESFIMLTVSILLTLWEWYVPCWLRQAQRWGWGWGGQEDDHLWPGKKEHPRNKIVGRGYMWSFCWVFLFLPQREYLRPWYFCLKMHLISS